VASVGRSPSISCAGAGARKTTSSQVRMAFLGRWVTSTGELRLHHVQPPTPVLADPVQVALAARAGLVVEGSVGGIAREAFCFAKSRNYEVTQTDVGRSGSVMLHVERIKFPVGWLGGLISSFASRFAPFKGRNKNLLCSDLVKECSEYFADQRLAEFADNPT
jgi:hypothetical protein